MKRRFAVGTVLALILVLSVTVTAMAAGPGPNAASVQGAGMAGQGAAVYGTFLDEDADGTCDSYDSRVPVQDGTGNRWASGNQSGTGVPGAGFFGRDGNGGLNGGNNLQDGTGQQVGRGGRWNR